MRSGRVLGLRFAIHYSPFTIHDHCSSQYYDKYVVLSRAKSAINVASKAGVHDKAPISGAAEPYSKAGTLIDTGKEDIHKDLVRISAVSV
jgi:hypothetical protein